MHETDGIICRGAIDNDPFKVAPALSSERFSCNVQSLPSVKRRRNDRNLDKRLLSKAADVCFGSDAYKQMATKLSFRSKFCRQPTSLLHICPMRTAQAGGVLLRRSF